MRFFLVSALMLWAPLASAYEETLKIPGSPEIRAAIGPRNVVENFGYVQGEIVLRLQIVSAFAFEALKFQPPTIANARVVTVLKPRTKAVSTYAGSGFVFETAFAIFPLQHGELVIPAIIAEGVIEPKPGEPASFRTETLEQRIPIKAPAPEFQSDWWIVTPRIEVEDLWSSPPEDAHVGDVIRREVIMTVYGVEAERLPDLRLTGSTGVAVSDHGGDRSTLLSTEGVIGKISRAWDIRVVDPRVAEIGIGAVEHWHPDYHRSLTVMAEAKRLEPAPADPAALATQLIAEAEGDRRAGLAAGVALFVLLLSPFAALLGAFVWAMLPDTADRRLKASLCATTSSKDVWKAVDQWALATKTDLAGCADDYRKLSATLFSNRSAKPEYKILAKALTAISRQARIRGMRRKVKGWMERIVGPKRSLVS